MPIQLNVLALFTNAERYIFAYDDESVERVVNEVWRMASDSTCRLNWFDAVLLTKRLRQQQRRAEEAEE